MTARDRPKVLVKVRFLLGVPIYIRYSAEGKSGFLTYSINVNPSREPIMEFVHPFPGKKVGDKVTKQEIISAVRLALCAEEEAVHLYDTIAEFADDEKVKNLMKDVADEEQVHAGEFQKLLDELQDDEVEKVEEGKKEAGEKMEESASSWVRSICTDLKK